MPYEMQKIKVGVLCGGPSKERGISLNSARSVLDHLESDQFEVIPFYFDAQKNPYKISKYQLYSNTPADFDFKLGESAQLLDEKNLIKEFNKVDIVFPVIHGAFGEDGEIQKFLEKNNIPFVGSDSKGCKNAFDKYCATKILEENGFFTLPIQLLKIYDTEKNNQKIRDFWSFHKLERAVVKPATGGSSIGVFVVNSVEESMEACAQIFSKRMDTRVVIEPFAKGKEFTVVLLQNRFDMPVAILPTEIEPHFLPHEIFDFRRKYLPTRQVTYHCPPRFSNEVVEKIQIQSEQIFSLMGMKDFARFDGWIMEDGQIWFSDLNPISGMEQNSFLFQQSSRIGLSHAGALSYILRSSLRRQGIAHVERSIDLENTKKSPIRVIFGGQTSERQVSVMSGTNVYLKLKKSEKYNPEAYLFDHEKNIWKLPYAFLLNHTVEEIYAQCLNAPEDQCRLDFLVQKAHLKMAFEEGESDLKFFLPQKYSLKQFLSNSTDVFIALHGGDGEDGSLQVLLEEREIRFNGSSSVVSKVCMDKWETAKALNSLEKEGVFTSPQYQISLDDLKRVNDAKDLFQRLKQTLLAKHLIIKPQKDGCSSGIVKLETSKCLQTYVEAVKNNLPNIPEGSFDHALGVIEMPSPPSSEYLIERFMETDRVRSSAKKLQWKTVNDIVEVTVGFIRNNKECIVLSPSQTVAEGAVLSVEEKFQGGTGINITPPPEQYVSAKVLKKVKERIEKVVMHLNLWGYGRIDAFINIKTGEITVIEVNSLPALTPATVIYHQALSQNPPLPPREFLEYIIDHTFDR